MVTRICPLQHAPGAGRRLAQVFKDTWPAFFEAWPVEEIERQMFAVGEPLPVILVCQADGRLAGTVALRARSVETHEHLGPWVTGLWVTPELRGAGLGRELLQAIEKEGEARGFHHIHAVTNTARWLFSKMGWEAVEEIEYHGEEVTLYRRIA